jgi:hypothetical protein
MFISSKFFNMIRVYYKKPAETPFGCKSFNIAFFSLDKDNPNWPLAKN